MEVGGNGCSFFFEGRESPQIAVLLGMATLRFSCCHLNSSIFKMMPGLRILSTDRCSPLSNPTSLLLLFPTLIQLDENAPRLAMYLLSVSSLLSIAFFLSNVSSSSHKYGLVLVPSFELSTESSYLFQKSACLHILTRTD